MAASRTKHRLCLICSGPLVKDDRDHYGYQCHPCVVHEHELMITLRTDPDHPDIDRLFDHPVDLGLPPRPGSRD